MASPDDIQVLEDLVLALAYAPGPKGKVAEPLRGKTVIQKLLFHMKKSVGKGIPVEEMPHFYGPFDEVASSVFDGLENSGYLKTDKEHKIIHLTSKGVGEAKSVWDQKLSDRERQVISALKAQFGDLSTDEVLAVTYAKYPESAAASIVKEKLSGQRGASIAVDLVRRGKISTDLGAKIANMRLKDFIHVLSKQKIPVVRA